MVKLILLTVCVLTGCSSSTTVIREGDAAGGNGGDAGASAGAAGDSAGAGGSASGAGGAGSGGNAGSAGAGSGGDAGAAGGSGDSGGGCIPKTCLTVAVELSNGAANADACGVVSDGCGNFIDCGGCDDPAKKCGELPPPNPDKSAVASNQHICGGGCTDVNAVDSDRSFWCNSTDDRTKIFYCTNQAEATSTHRVCNQSVYVSDGQYTVWCCVYS